MLNFLKVQKLGDMFHITDFVREELDDGFVSSNFAHIGKSYEECSNFIGDIITLCKDGLSYIDLHELHDWGNKAL